MTEQNLAYSNALIVVVQFQVVNSVIMILETLEIANLVGISKNHGSVMMTDYLMMEQKLVIMSALFNMNHHMKKNLFGTEMTMVNGPGLLTIATL